MPRAGCGVLSGSVEYEVRGVKWAVLGVEYKVERVECGAFHRDDCLEPSTELK